MIINRIRTAYGSSIVFDIEMQGSWCSVHLKIPFKDNNETTVLRWTQEAPRNFSGSPSSPWPKCLSMENWGTIGRRKPKVGENNALAHSLVVSSKTWRLEQILKGKSDTLLTKKQWFYIFIEYSVIFGYMYTIGNDQIRIIIGSITEHLLCLCLRNIQDLLLKYTINYWYCCFTLILRAVDLLLRWFQSLSVWNQFL